MRLRPYKERHLVLETGGFFVKDKRFLIDDIVSLYFYYVQTQKYLNFSPAGIDHDVEVRVYLKGDPRPVTITAGPVVRIGSGGKKPSESLIAKYDYLRETSFRARFTRYLGQFEKTGLFIYDGKRIYKNGDVVGDNWRFNMMTDRPVLRRPCSFLRKAGNRIFKTAGEV
jgi:hypothetical protein